MTINIPFVAGGSFTLALEQGFKELSWDKKGIKVDAVFLNRLRYADDIVLISSDGDVEKLTAPKI